MSVRRKIWLSALGLGLWASAAAPACSSDDFTGATPKGGSGNKEGGSGTGGLGGGTGGTHPDSGSDAGKADGSTCTAGTECDSGHCVDGVCCESACSGACQSCKLAGKLGQCTPQPAGTDPEGDCQTADSGAGSCEESCDGKGACVSCGEFNCGASACLTTCSGDTDCKATGWCNAGSCEAKKANGQACGGTEQCQSGLCEGGFCCKSSCASPNSCETGECACGGVVCSAANPCQIWYLDQDGDGFAASSSFDKASCLQPPDANGKHYMSGAPTDCYDQNANAFPGQTQYFSADRGDGSYDYDCDSQQSPKFPSVPATSTCAACGQGDPGNCQKCTNSIAPVPINPGYQCAAGCGGGSQSAFKAPVSCGANGTLYTCNPVAPTCAISESNAPNTAQACR